MTLDLTDLVTAIGLVFVLEGVLYALFPAAMQRMITRILTLPVEHIRITGLVSMALGVLIVWLVRG